MIAGTWYRQSFSDETYYFRPSGVVQKNGKRAGTLVVIYTDRPRMRPRVKASSVARCDFSLWRPEPNVPPHVAFYASTTKE